MEQFDGTRETALTAAIDWILEDIIMPECEGMDKPPVRITIGWPKGSRGARKIMATCHPRAHSSDGHNEIFVSPTVGDSLLILESVVHEAIHAMDDCASGHRGFFARTARRVGLEGKFTETVAGDELKEALQWWLDENGAIPVAAMDDSKRKKQGTRLLLINCAAECGFKVRASSKVVRLWMEGETFCPACGAQLMFNV